MYKTVCPVQRTSKYSTRRTGIGHVYRSLQSTQRYVVDKDQIRQRGNAERGGITSGAQEASEYCNIDNPRNPRAFAAIARRRLRVPSLRTRERGQPRALLWRGATGGSQLAIYQPQKEVYWKTTLWARGERARQTYARSKHACSLRSALALVHDLFTLSTMCSREF